MMNFRGCFTRPYAVTSIVHNIAIFKLSEHFGISLGNKVVFGALV